MLVYQADVLMRRENFERICRAFVVLKFFRRRWVGTVLHQAISDETFLHADCPRNRKGVLCKLLTDASVQQYQCISALGKGAGKCRIKG
eukprot:5606616-Amphidinium_carterae.1